MRAHARITGRAAGRPGGARPVVRGGARRPDAFPVGNQALVDRLRRGEVPPEVNGALRTPGRPLDPATRALMERRFGRSFGRVRVHTGAEAAASARAVAAQAYSVGDDVVFDTGRYAPGSPRGRGLLAHELAHVAQQKEASGPGLMPGGGGSAAETQADGMARAAARGRPVPTPSRAARQVMRATRTFSLTFDDGPHAAPLGGGKNLTENVLDTLKARSIKGAFFVQTGVSYRMANPVGRALVARMHAEGHTVGIHTGGTKDHELHTKAQAAGRLAGELTAGKAAIEKVTGSTPTLVRPPTGALDKAVEATYATAGLTNLLWDIDLDKGSSLPLADLKARVEDGVAEVHGRGWKTTTPSPTIVVLLHDIQAGTSRNLGAIIDHIKATVTELTGGKDSANFSAP
jgi:peptidoglycan/xylan/chitin deacetylase (PgdA/CDA1 family)